MILGIGLSKNSNRARSNSALLFAGSVDDPENDARRDYGEACRVSHDPMLCFQRRVHLLIASILIVPGDEFRMLDELRGASNSPDQNLPGGGVSRRARLCILARDERRQIEDFKPGFERSPPHHPRYG